LGNRSGCAEAHFPRFNSGDLTIRKGQRTNPTNNATSIDKNMRANNTVVSPPEQPTAADTSVKESALKAAPTAASVVEQPASVLDENHPEETDQLRPGKVFACFVLERELEIGCTGAIWLAQDYGLGRHAKQAALKFLPDTIVSDKTAVEELKHKIRRRIALRHPNIQRVYDLVEDKGRVAIQMEYMDGQSLSRLRLTKPNQIFEVRDLENWVNELCEALEYAHKNIGVINADIVPGNLVVDVAGNLKLKDFGIANCITDSMNRLMVIHDTGQTLPYMSPQRARGEESAITDDLYSLGATIYELLTGKPAFYAGDIGAQVSRKTPPSMTQRRAEFGIGAGAIPKNWEETVAACLVKDPIQRPQSAIKVKKQLKNATSPPGISANSEVGFRPDSSAKPQTPVRTPPAWKPWLVRVSIIFVLAFVSAMVFFRFHGVTEGNIAKIVLDTIPANANVFLDGASRGTTPLVIEDVAPGDRQLRIEREGYEPQMLIVAVKKGNQEYSRLIHLVRVDDPAIAPSPSDSIGEKSLSVAAPHTQVNPTPSPGASPAPSLEVSPTPSLEAGPTPPLEASLAPSLGASPTPSPEASPTPSPQETAASHPRHAADPSSTPLSQLDFDATKEEVIKRINALPGVTAEKKASLIENMHKARSMERLTVVHFDIGQTALHRAATEQLLKAFDSPEMRDKLSDPTIILVVAGYADTDGNADLNLRFSRERAENVSKLLKEQAGLLNAMQTIGMGGTELLDNKRPNQNRAVEVWAVVPR
jgi:serine/threonine protein kinase/outer membrane protein OmpA-like peptidoglycan-associated protein